MGTSLFSRGTAVAANGDGRFTADLGEHWNCPIVPQGGIVAATAARAMDAAPPPGVERRAPFDFWQHVEGRPTLGHAPWEDYEPASSLRAYWYRFDDPPRADDGAWDPYALVALRDTMPGAVSERVGPGDGRQWLPPSADFTVHLFGEARGEWVLAVNRGPPRGCGLRLGRHGDLGRRRRGIPPGSRTPPR